MTSPHPTTTIDRTHLAASQDRIELNQICLKAKRQCILNKYVKLYNLRFACGQMGDDAYGVPFTYLRDKIFELTDKLKEQRKKSQSPWVWLTVSPDPKKIKSIFDTVCKKHGFVTLENPTQESYELYEKCVKETHQLVMIRAQSFADSALFDDYIFVWEQRKTQATIEDSLDIGAHFHFILYKSPTYCFSKVVARSKNAWKNYLDVNNPSIFHIKNCPEKYVQDKVDYITGKKLGDGKPEKVIFDDTLRTYFNFKSFYRPEFSENDVFWKYLPKE